jgi:hypothetical protein
VEKVELGVMYHAPDAESAKGKEKSLGIAAYREASYSSQDLSVHALEHQQFGLGYAQQLTAIEKDRKAEGFI